MGKKSKVVRVVQVVQKVKGRRGRPKGSKNRDTLVREAEEKLRRETKEQPPQLHPPRNFKHLGYCEFCRTVIGDCDIEGKHYKCAHCGESGLRKKLKKKKDVEKFDSKKDYLSHVTEDKVLEAPMMSDELDPATIVVRE